MEHKEQKQGGGNGFILGVLLGAAIVLLFTTKKGRAILRDVSDKVINKLSHLDDLANKADDKIDLIKEEFAAAFEEEEEEYIKTEPLPKAVKEEILEEEAEAKEAPVEEKKVIKEEPKVVKPEPKPEPKPDPTPESEVKKEEPEEDVEELDEKSEEEEPQVKAPTKVIQGRRWFRGLRKK